jgi:hypothetical protein
MIGGDRRGVVALSLALVALVAAGVATGARPAPLRGVYVGRVAGTQAFVAVAVGHGQARAYMCDSRRLGVWLPPGRLRGGRLDLKASGVRLTGSVDGAAARGTVTLADGSRHAFKALLAPGKRPVGLYRAVKTVHGTRYVAGWILLRGGAQRGEVVKLNININTADETLAAPKLNPEAASVQLPGAGTASVVKLGDSFVSKTTNG